MDNSELIARIEKLEGQIKTLGIGNSYATDVQIGLAVQRFLTTQALSIGKSLPVACALLELSSIRKGVVFSRMTTAQRDAVVNPVAGLFIYNTTTNKFNGYTTAWEAITSA